MKFIFYPKENVFIVFFIVSFNVALDKEIEDYLENKVASFAQYLWKWSDWNSLSLWNTN